MKTKKSKTLFALRKGFTLLLSICLAVTAIAAAGSISASAETNTIQKRALAVSAPLSSGDWFANNANAFEKAFEHIGVPTETFISTVGTKESIFSAIQSAFSGSDENDINYLLLSSHGSAEGMALNPFVTYAEIRECLDSIPGDFIVMVSCCGSGGAITASSLSEQNEVTSEDSDFTSEAIMNAFLFGSPDGVMPMSGELADSPKYTVFCSTAANETAYAFSNHVCSYAVRGWLFSTGYDAYTDTFIAVTTDTNNDEIITASEFHMGAYDYVTPIFENDEHPQHPCYYSRYECISVIYSDYPLGDITMDNCINDDDLQAIRNILVHIGTYTDRQMQLADLNGDGNVNLQDLTAMRKYLADF